MLLKKDAVTSYSATPYGQSDDPDSTHYDDQAEKLFSRGRLRPTWYAKRDLLRHVESARTLTVPRAAARMQRSGGGTLLSNRPSVTVKVY